MAKDPRGDEFKHPDGNEDGDWLRCPHCDGMGLVNGPGGKEECCHCHGKGERWFDRDEGKCPECGVYRTGGEVCEGCLAYREHLR